MMARDIGSNDSYALTFDEMYVAKLAHHWRLRVGILSIASGHAELIQAKLLDSREPIPARLRYHSQCLRSPCSAAFEINFKENLIAS
jgi:hypothetical protein